jgi:formylglycine-generating enzyme required for sulfatase activity
VESLGELLLWIDRTWTVFPLIVTAWLHNPATSSVRWGILWGSGVGLVLGVIGVYATRPQTGRTMMDWAPVLVMLVPLLGGAWYLYHLVAEWEHMVHIPGGCFEMGSPPSEADRSAREGPVHRVCVEDFALSKYEVTVREYRAFVAATRYRTETEGSTNAVDRCYALDWRDRKKVYGPKEWATWRMPTDRKNAHDDEPVRCVSWNDAQAYVQWLNSIAGGGYRLPSEAEWEYAARAGTRTVYFWGDTESDACTYANMYDRGIVQSSGGKFRGGDTYPCSDGHINAAPVGSYKPNQWGLYDMIGNVTEWVEDCWHSSYLGAAPTDGSVWRSGDCSQRMMRGGMYLVGLKEFNRAAAREADSVGVSREYLGFRVARDVAE